MIFRMLSTRVIKRIRIVNFVKKLQTLSCVSFQISLENSYYYKDRNNEKNHVLSLLYYTRRSDGRFIMLT